METNSLIKIFNISILYQYEAVRASDILRRKRCLKTEWSSPPHMSDTSAPKRLEKKNNQLATMNADKSWKLYNGATTVTPHYADFEIL